MAKRICFISTPEKNPIFEELEVEFEYFSGFAVSQKQKSISSMHLATHVIKPSLRILEVSSKSMDPLGVALSAFNLKFFDEETGKEYPLENIFQSSKVFELGGPYKDLLDVLPKDAKRDERLKTSGKLKYFKYNGEIWNREPKTMFYDWIYMKSLYNNKELAEQILAYDAFTDIEFNPHKSMNCQARAAAIFVSLSRLGLIEKALNSKDVLRSVYPTVEEVHEQISLL